MSDHVGNRGDSRGGGKVGDPKTVIFTFSDYLRKVKFAGWVGGGGGDQ